MFVDIYEGRQKEMQEWLQDQIQKAKSIEPKKVTTRVEDVVICPFCFETAWLIGSTYIKCEECGVEFDKRFIKNNNIYSINKNLEFLRDLYYSGVSESKLGIKVCIEE